MNISEADLHFIGLRKAERGLSLSPGLSGAIRWPHVKIWPIAPFFLINSSLCVILRLLSTRHGAPNCITDILLGVHCINVMRELEILKVRKLP